MLYESKELTALALSGKALGKGIMKVFKKKIKQNLQVLLSH